MNIEKKIFSVILGLLLFMAGSSVLFPEITITGGVKVKILYDYSGSMYPGYPDHRRHELGVKYIHRYPHFQDWLAGFVNAQSRFNANRVSMSVFRSFDRFQPGDITRVHPPVPLNRFDALHACSHPRPGGIDYTYLAQSLDHFTGGNFEGLVWLITDNRVETGGAETTRDFFTALRDTPKYRSIHIYRLPFRDDERGQQTDLAIYGIMVSPSPLAPAVSSWFDQRFIEFKNRFRQRQHLKLKDLSVEPIRINIEPIVVDIDSDKKGITEGGVVKLKLTGTIKSNLTQHTITGGTLHINVNGNFKPDPKAREKYKVKVIPGHLFAPVSIDLTEEIPPNGERQLPPFYLRSKGKVSLDISGLGNLIKAATSSVRVQYSAKGMVASDQLRVELKQEGRNRITGIYSSGDIDVIFGSQSSITQIAANPSPFDIQFSLKSGGIRMIVFLLLVLLFLALLGALFFVLNKKESYRIKKGSKEETTQLRRLAGRNISHEGVLLGVLKRGLGNEDTFTPNRNLASLAVNEGNNPGEYNVTISQGDNKQSFKLVIEPVDKSRTIVTKSGPAFQAGSSSRSDRGNRPGGGIGGTGAGGAAPRKPGDRPGPRMRKPS